MAKISDGRKAKSGEYPNIFSDDDDFQDPSPSLVSFKSTPTQKLHKPPKRITQRPPKKLKPALQTTHSGKENAPPFQQDYGFGGSQFELDLSDAGLDLIESTFECQVTGKLGRVEEGKSEIRLDDDNRHEECEGGTQLDLLLKLCKADEDAGACGNDSSFSDDDVKEEEEEEEDGCVGDKIMVCPLCGKDITELSIELREAHTNDCLDKEGATNEMIPPHEDKAHTNECLDKKDEIIPPRGGHQCPGQVFNNSPGHSPHKVDASPILEWLRNLGLAKYEEVFVREEIDWDTLKWLTEEDLFGIGVAALGPRKKLIHAIKELRKEGGNIVETHADVTRFVPDEVNKPSTNKLITDFFPGSVAVKKRDCNIFKGSKQAQTSSSKINPVIQKKRSRTKDLKPKTIPIWCDIPGTPFRVDAFKNLRRDCSHWFLTHFHMDHYQGLTKSFCHGKIYCSLITAKLVNMKLGIAWDKLQILPLNQKINVSGVDVTCFDANHCPGAIIILFEPPSGKAVLHTGDFRFCDEMARIHTLQTSPIHTLILDTTYCDPQYDFPKQEAVIQFVLEAIQAEKFNPKTLFLIGSYTIGKERLFLEVARVLRKKIYVTAAKLRILECLGFPEEDSQWFTLNEHESHIHVVPMWAIASFKRLKHLANQYTGRFDLIVSFSPTGWSFSKGKKKSPGRRWQQGTIIRYEVPYSEHSSFSELREFVKFISPASIIPSVNNYGSESANTMLACLLA